MGRKSVIKISLFCIIIGGFYWLSIFLGFNAIPFKVIDPHDPRFNPEKFRVKDYAKSPKELAADALRATFPVGTPKSRVDKIWKDNMGAQFHHLIIQTEYEGHRYSLYSYKGSFGAYIKGPPSTFVIFDEDMRVVNIWSHMATDSGDLYKDQLSVNSEAWDYNYRDKYNYKEIYKKQVTKK